MSPLGLPSSSPVMDNPCVLTESAPVAVSHATDLTLGAPALSLREAAIVVLLRIGKPMRASQIAAHINTLGLRTVSASATPAQSINRDLHAAVRKGDTRVMTGEQPGLFCAVPHGTVHPPAAAPTVVVTRGPRLPIEPLHATIELLGGIGALGAALSGAQHAATLQRLTRTYHRSVERGWISIYDADCLCIQLLRMHPCMLWGAGWWDAA